MLSERYNTIKRQVGSATLVAVTKNRSVDQIKALYELGQRDFGENYAQEAAAKIEALSDYSDIVWHFIGAIQSNKTKLIATHFDWVQSVDRPDIAKRLNNHANQLDRHLNVCIGVNVDAELQKSGVLTCEVSELANEISELDNLTLRGLMTIPKRDVNDEQRRESFHKMKELFDMLKQTIPTCDTLSMGMSDSYPLALEMGSTMVRIGRTLFT